MRKLQGNVKNVEGRARAVEDRLNKLTKTLSTTGTMEHRANVDDRVLDFQGSLLVRNVGWCCQNSSIHRRQVLLRMPALHAVGLVPVVKVKPAMRKVANKAELSSLVQVVTRPRKVRRSLNEKKCSWTVVMTKTSQHLQPRNRNLKTTTVRAMSQSQGKLHRRPPSRINFHFLFVSFLRFNTYTQDGNPLVFFCTTNKIQIDHSFFIHCIFCCTFMSLIKKKEGKVGWS